MLGGWLSQPHVARWYDDAEPEAEELRDPRISMWIATFAGRPFAFGQDYDVHGLYHCERPQRDAVGPGHPFDGRSLTVSKIESGRGT